MTYEPVIGLEIHVQTKTQSKMFCGCDANYFGAEPNTHTCPTCLGLPGALPVPNDKAIEHAVRIALALGCSINLETKFDRKNYFYPDLPKGYQITQYDQPIGLTGRMAIDVDGILTTIRITRVHQEEDTGKSMHENTVTLLDYNKSGVPLVEIVTEPDFHSAAEVLVFAHDLRLLLRYLKVSDADMEKGQMRFEPNISLRPTGSSKLPDYKVEVKNIGSISVLERVIAKEIARQKQLLDTGQTPTQETRGLVDMTGKTVSQRTKETSKDYRYFPEPDIPPIVFTQDNIDSLKKRQPELPNERKARYTKTYGLKPSIADTIIQNQQLADLFEETLSDKTEAETAQEVANWIAGDYVMLQRKHPDISVKPTHLLELASLVVAKTLARTAAKSVFETCMTTGKSPAAIVKEQDLAVVSDDTALETAVKRILADNSKAVADIKENPNAIMFLVGQVMKEMNGKADPNTIRSLIESNI